MTNLGNAKSRPRQGGSTISQTSITMPSASVRRASQGVHSGAKALMWLLGSIPKPLCRWCASHALNEHRYAPHVVSDGLPTTRKCRPMVRVTAAGRMVSTGEFHPLCRTRHLAAQGGHHYAECPSVRHD